MKKISAKLSVVLLTVVLCMALITACGKKDNSGDADDKVQMTESYEKARNEFKAVTGIELPALEGLVIEEAFPYQAGATSYEVDITAGDNLSRETFDAMVTFLDTALSGWTKENPSQDGPYTNVWYASAAGRIGITWDSENLAIYVHAVMGNQSGGNGGNEQGNGNTENGNGQGNTNQGTEQGNGNTNQGNGQDQPASNMTASYRNGREQFHAISGIWLPELGDCELLGSSDLRTNQHTVACFDISGTADDLAEIIDCLQEQIGHAPARSDASGAIWLVDACFGDVWYGGQVDVMIDTDADPVAIYVNYSVGEVDESYLCAQEFFAMATGVELPLRSGLIGSICVTGDLMFDITDGDGRSQYEYKLFEAFFDRTIPGWTKDAPAEADRDYTEGYTHINYTTTGCAINFVWDAENQGIYLNVTQVRDDFAPLPRIYEIIEKKFGVEIPEIENVALSMFTYDNNDITLNVGGAGFTYEAYLSLEAAFTDALGAMEEDFPTGNEEDGRDAQWKANGYWFSTTWAPAGINPYTELPYDASFDVNISLLP